jgi:hypothetical protein
MSIEAETAKECFAENFRYFGADPVNAMEKFNLYTGLTQLAKAVAGIDSRLYQIESELAQIRIYLSGRS